jgi:hypothetical protein
MGSGDDVLEQLWVEVINLDPKGAWIEAAIKQCESPELPDFRAAADALKKLSRDRARREDLSRVGRFVRYEACFGALYSLSDPGLKQNKIAGLHEKLSPAQRKGKQTEKAFFDSLWENISPDDDGKWLVDLARKKAGDAPFDDTGASVKQLKKGGATARELGAIAAWHRYDASFHTLRLLQESGIKTGDEADGLYELLLGSDPSGMEGRPGSWPLQNNKAAKAKGKAEPLWKIRSVQACAFSPDGETLAVAGASSPVRLFDLASGKERLACEGIKVHIYRIAFSPDGRQVAAGKIHKEITICDTKTGKVLHKLKRSEHEISALVYASADELLCSAWCNEIYCFDPRDGKKKSSLVLAKGDCMVNDMAFSADGKQLAVLWDELRDDANRSHATIWDWPSRKQKLDVPLPDGFHQGIDWVPRQSQFAVCDGNSGVTFFDGASGKRLAKLGSDETRLLTFTPDGKHLLTTKEYKLALWDVQSRKKLKQFDLDCNELAISPNRKYLAAVTPQGAQVWRSEDLV